MRLLPPDIRIALAPRLILAALVLSVLGATHPADAQVTECDGLGYNDRVTTNCLSSTETSDCEDLAYNERISAACDPGDVAEPTAPTAPTAPAEPAEPAATPAATSTTQPDDQEAGLDTTERSTNLRRTAAAATIAGAASLVVVVRRRRPAGSKDQLAGQQ